MASMREIFGHSVKANTAATGAEKNSIEKQKKQSEKQVETAIDEPKSEEKKRQIEEKANEYITKKKKD